MTTDDTIADHYTHGSLVAAIEAGLKASGVAVDAVTTGDLAPVDEFHVGGRQATDDFVSQLGLDAAHRVLDIGSGLGGPSRYIAQTVGCTVTGIDLTEEYVETARVLSSWTGLADRTRFECVSALEMPFEDASFDVATLFHVGMNIEDKTALAAEVARVLKPGGTFGLYEVMRVEGSEHAGGLEFPVPWATTSAASFVAPPDTYRAALEAAGLVVQSSRNRRDFAIEFFKRLRERSRAADGPPPIGLHIVLGESGTAKIANMVANINAGRIAPVEMIAQKVG